MVSEDALCLKESGCILGANNFYWGYCFFAVGARGRTTVESPFFDEIEVMLLPLIWFFMSLCLANYSLCWPWSLNTKT